VRSCSLMHWAILKRHSDFSASSPCPTDRRSGAGRTDSRRVGAHSARSWVHDVSLGLRAGIGCMALWASCYRAPRRLYPRRTTLRRSCLEIGLLPVPSDLADATKEQDVDVADVERVGGAIVSKVIRNSCSAASENIGTNRRLFTPGSTWMPATTASTCAGLPMTLTRRSAPSSRLTYSRTPIGSPPTAGIINSVSVDR